MTNEEKASEISFRISSFGSRAIQISYLSAMRMAEWKDQQLKELLEKKLSEVDVIKRWAITDFLRGFCHGKEVVIKQIINELFKEE